MNKPFILFGIIMLFASCQTSEEKLIEKALKIHNKAITIDSHTDTPLLFTRESYDMSVRHDPYETSTKVDFPRMKEGGLDGIFMAVFLGQGPRDKEGHAKVTSKTHQIFDSIYSMLDKNKDIASLALKAQDIYSIEKEGKRAVYIGIENGYALGGKLDNVDVFYKRGARYITLCHTKNNDLCDSSTDTIEHNGVSKFGKEVIAKMNRLGMLVDVSHISDKSFYDVIELSTSPVIASHSSSRAICDSPRNLTDDMLIKLAENGGVAQVCILSSYIKKTPTNPQADSMRMAIRKKYNNYENLSDEQQKEAGKAWRSINKLFPPILATVQDVVDHIDHMVKVAGIDHVGIGTDFDGGGGVDGCFDDSELPNITIEMVRRGYNEEDIIKIWGGNFLRVLSENEELAKI
ncbi:MAG: membrane dipeptidase [Bacteroidetes bacterium]|nr:MAG: membrane dipeptidase [Bacteroidota bacterium]